MLRITIYLLLSLGATIGGAFLFYEYAFHTNFLLIILGILAITIGAVMSGMFTATLIFPKSRSIILADKGKETYLLLKQAIGKRKTNTFSVIVIVLTFAIFLGALGSSIYYFEIRNDEELSNYGKIVTVEIEDIYYSRGRTARFSFEYNNNLYTHSLHSNDLEIGDSIDIMYSTQKPDLVRWAKRK